jgi:3-dehydroquinate dehydratase/shikimate dehydrogenase
LKVAHDFYNTIQGKKPEKVKIIVSSHNYQNTPSLEEIGNLVVRIQATGADIVKVATTAVDITDSARVFQILVHSQVSNLYTIFMLIELQDSLVFFFF